MNQQSGQITAEFLFAIVIAFGLFMLFFAITFTFSVVEVGQYIVFSSARAQAASNVDADAQKEAAIQKYKLLSNDPAFQSLFKNGWFVFAKTPEVRQGGTDGQGTFLSELGKTSGEQFLKVFTGVSVAFQSKLLGISIPFISTAKPDDAGFKTHINAIVLRESSQDECYKYWDQRATALKQIPSGRDGQFYNPGKYARMEDNGC